MLKPFLGTLALSSALWVNVYATSPTEPIAVVNGKNITQQEYDNYLKKHQGTEQVSPKVVIDNLINRELVKQDVSTRGLDKTQEFADTLEEFRQSLMTEMGLRDYLNKHPIDEASLKKEYDKRISKVDLPKEYQVKHILLKTEEEAKAVIAQLDQGKTFAQLAKEKSIDQDSAKQEGDLGWMNREKVAPEFAQAMEKMAKGERSKTPVKTLFGWHVIQVDDVRTTPPPDFEVVKDRIQAIIQNQRIQDYLDDLKKTAQIKVLKEELKQENSPLPTEPAHPTPGAK